MAAQVRRAAVHFRRNLAQKKPPADGCVARVGIGGNFSVQFGDQLFWGVNRPPLALAQIRPVVVPQTDHIDLNLLIPVLAHRECGIDALPFVKPRQCFPAQALEAVSNSRTANSFFLPINICTPFDIGGLTSPQTASPNLSSCNQTSRDLTSFNLANNRLNFIIA